MSSDKQSASKSSLMEGASHLQELHVEQLTKDGFKTLMEAIKHSNALPSGADYKFHSVSDTFKKIVTDQSNTVMQVMNKLMRCNSIDGNIKSRVLDEQIELVIEANDAILERVANNIDEMNGLRKNMLEPVELQTVSAEIPVNGSWNRLDKATISINAAASHVDANRCIKLITAKNIVKPQKLFKDKIDNEYTAWVPRITDKPNSLKPLAIFLEEYEGRHEYCHPYDYELERIQPTAEQLKVEAAVLPKSLAETPLEEIFKAEQLFDLVETLRNYKVIAVDLEHHSYRTFMGITCLLQISTPDKDYLIDTLALRDRLHVLNEIFTRNSIVKIFHGAGSDVEWLQRDCSIYIVNMFDTHQAAKALQYSSLSLAFLMKKFCNVLPDKQYQLADWRIRPLPDELKRYAREDTHYLIYIYQMLKKELLMKKNGADNLVRFVLERSTEICRKRYFKPVFMEDSHLAIYRKFKKQFNNRQMYALKHIYAWRDKLARDADESLGYVLPNHMLLQLAETLPREIQGISACCNPIPPLVKSHTLQLHQIILKARDQPLETAISKDTTGRGVLKKISKVNVDSALHCPHDLSKANEFRDDLPTLLNDVSLQAMCRNAADVKLVVEKTCSYSLFGGQVARDLTERGRFKTVHGVAYLSPFERYKLVKPFVASEEAAKTDADSVKQEENVERKDEDRISSIREHFVQLSRRFSDELQAQKQKEEREQEQSLLEMGGSRKRKRETFNVGPEPTVGNSQLDSPAPVLYHWDWNRGQKRKFSEIGDGGDEGGSAKKNKSSYHKRQQRRQQQQNCNQQAPPSNFQEQRQQKQTKRKQKKQQQQQQPQNKGQVKNAKKKAQKQSQNSSFAPYDYASVDFRQFQGGAGSANGGANVKSNFKPKNRNKKFNKGAKSATFTNSPHPGRGGPNNKRQWTRDQQQWSQ